MTTPYQRVFGITGTRQTGKDTLFNHLAALDENIVRYAYADSLKSDLAPFLVQHFGIDIWTCTAEEKELSRPLLIAYGMAQRSRDPLHWVKKTVASIQTDLASGLPIGICVTDIRFTNEASHMFSTFPGFQLINLTREGAPTPTDEEEKNFRQVAAMANHHIHWGGDTAESQRAVAASLLKHLIVPPVHS